MNKILQALETHAQTRANDVAFVGQTDDGEQRSLTYLQLSQRVEQAAQSLKELDVSCIALRAENSLDWLVVDLAAMKANVVLVPVPTFFSDQQVEHTLAKANIELLVGDWQLDQQGDQLEPVARVSALPIYRHSVAMSESSVLPTTVKITFTSGSTGSPKGVCLSQENLDLVAHALAESMTSEGQSHLVLLPLSTLLENITGIYVPLILGVTSSIYHGSTLGLMGSSQFEPQVFAQALAKYQPSSLVLTPAILMALLHLAQISPALVNSLKFVAVGGAKVAPELIEKAYQLGIPAFEGYGLSECGSVVSLNTDKHAKSGTCGQLLSHVEGKISDDGELLVKGNIALGYLGEPFDQQWLATGDLASMDEDGFVTIVGRKKNQIITGFGRNVSPEWIESQAQLFAPACPIVVTGEAQMALSAVVAKRDDIASSIDKLNRTLPDYARIKNVLVVEDFSSRTTWFTDNGRPRRAEMEAWARAQLKEKGSDRYVTIVTLDTQFEQENQFEQQNQFEHQKMQEITMTNTTNFFQTLTEKTAQARHEMLQAPVFESCLRGEIDKDLYIDFLTQAYHHVKHTVPLLMACGGRLSEKHEWLREAIAEYIEEETGHQKWILNDIEACGGDSEQVRLNQGRGQASQAIELMLAYLYHNIDRHNPLALFGMVWVLEGTSVGIGGQIAQMVKTTLNLPEKAMTYLTSHSVLDQDHIQFFESLMNQITDENDQQVIIDSANMVFSLYGQMLRGLELSSVSALVTE